MCYWIHDKRVCNTDITSFQVEEIVKPYDGVKKQVNASLSYVTDNSPLPNITSYNTTHKYTYYTNNNKTLTNFLREETYEAYGLNNRKKTTSMDAYQYTRTGLIKKITIYQNEELEKVIEYSYDPLGNLIKEEVYKGTTSLTLVRTYNFYYDGQKLIREVLTEGNEENVIDYIYAESGLIGIRENYQIYQCYQNALKDIVAIYDKGTKVCTYNYTAYGETTIKNEERNGIPLSRMVKEAA